MPPSQDQPQYQPPQQPQPGQAAPQPAQPAPLKIDDALLAELGLGSLPPDEKQALRQHIYETLEMRVGMRLADQMTNEQLDEFETYFNAKDDAGAFRWLETNFPNYKDIVADEFNKLKSEVGQSAQQILAAAQQQAQAPAPAPAPVAPAAPQPPAPAAAPNQYQPQPPQPPQQPYQPPQPPQDQPQWPQPPQYPPPQQQ